MRNNNDAVSLFLICVSSLSLSLESSGSLLVSNVFLSCARIVTQTHSKVGQHPHLSNLSHIIIPHRPILTHLGNQTHASEHKTNLPSPDH